MSEKAITDTECVCGSRWVWSEWLWRWVNVVLAPNCDCGDPPEDWPECDPEAMALANAAHLADPAGGSPLDKPTGEDEG